MAYKNKEDAKRWREQNRDKVNAAKAKYRKRVGRKSYPEKTAEWRENNKAKCVFHAVKGRAKALYGIPLESFHVIRNRAETGNCEICGGKPSRIERGSGNGILHIDHPHGEKRMRGLLCHKCNTGLGSFRDSIETLQAAIDYLMVDSSRKVYA